MKYVYWIAAALMLLGVASGHAENRPGKYSMPTERVFCVVTHPTAAVRIVPPNGQLAARLKRNDRVVVTESITLDETTGEAAPDGKEEWFWVSYGKNKVGWIDSKLVGNCHEEGWK